MPVLIAGLSDFLLRLCCTYDLQTSRAGAPVVGFSAACSPRRAWPLWRVAVAAAAEARGASAHDCLLWIEHPRRGDEHARLCAVRSRVAGAHGRGSSSSAHLQAQARSPTRSSWACRRSSRFSRSNWTRRRSRRRRRSGRKRPELPHEGVVIARHLSFSPADCQCRTWRKTIRKPNVADERHWRSYIEFSADVLRSRLATVRMHGCWNIFGRGTDTRLHS